MKRHPILLMTVLVFSTLCPDVNGQTQALNDTDSLFDMKRVESIHLKFTEAEWQKLQPPKDVDWNIDNAFGKLGRDAMQGGDFRADDNKRAGLAGYMGINHQYGRADVTIDGQTVNDVGVRYKGNGTFWMGHHTGKYSFKIDFSEFVKKQNFLGLKKINVNNCVTDPSMLREALSYELFREAGVPASRTGWAEVTVSVGDDPKPKEMGLYLIVEQVDKRFLKRVYGSSEGLLVKPSCFGAFLYLGDDWEKYKLAYVPKTDATEEQAQRLIAFARLVHLADDQEFDARVEDYLDMDEFLSFLAVNVMLSNLDSFLGGTQNYYAYLDPATNKIQLIPWDLDISFGAFSLVGTPQTRRDLSIDRPQIGEGSNRVIERILAIPRFKQAYHERLRQLLDKQFNENKLIGQIEDQADFIRPFVSQQGDGAVQRFDAAIGDEPTQESPNSLKYFVQQRRKSIRDQLDGRSPGEHLNFGPMPPSAAMVFTLLGIVVAFLLGGVVNVAACIWGVIAGSRRNTLWCLLNLFLYPIAPIIFGVFVDRVAGFRSAVMTMFAVVLMVAITWFSIVGITAI